MKSLLRIVVWYPAALILLFGTIYTYLGLNHTLGSTALIRQEINQIKSGTTLFAAIPAATMEIKAAIATSDARPIVIRRYLERYNSPLLPYADQIVATADKYQLDPYLIVAIAQQESNLGKITPANCHNAWGWGIHSAGTLCFESWTKGLEVFSRGIADKYVAYGLRTPEEIMTKYNSTSPGGAWAKGVNQFLEDLQTGSW